MVRGRHGKSGFGYASTAEEVTQGLDLAGKNILITGVNSGLGAESARVLALRGARIFGAARSQEKAAAACAVLPALPGAEGDAFPVACDLADPRSVQACVRTLVGAGQRLDVILCNAGIMALPSRELVHGQERQFFTNHVGHFMLVTGLLDLLRDDGRVVMVSSAAHRMAPRVGIQFDDLSFARKYAGRTAYGQSKLANLLFARALAERFRGTDRTANALHPGVIHTKLTRHMNPVIQVGSQVGAALAMKSIPEGSGTQCYVATHPTLAGVSGEYFADCNVRRSSRHGRDQAMASRLWTVTEEIVAAISLA